MTTDSDSQPCGCSKPQKEAILTLQDLLALHDKICVDAQELVIGKNMAYATPGDPFRNFREYGSLGILVRLSDKMSRLRRLDELGAPGMLDETIYDTVVDLINYAVLYVGYRQQHGNVL